MVIAGWVRAVVSKFSEVQPCAAADRPRSATMPRRFPASASRAVTAFIHISKEPRRRLAQPDNVGQRFFRSRLWGGERPSLSLCHSRESGNPERAPADPALASRFRGNDKVMKRIGRSSGGEEG